MKADTKHFSIHRPTSSIEPAMSCTIPQNRMTEAQRNQQTRNFLADLQWHMDCRKEDEGRRGA